MGLDVELADVCVVVVGPDVGLVVVGVAIVGLDVGLGLAVVGVVVVGLDVGVALLYKLQIKKFLNGQSMEGDLLQQLQLLLVAPGRWHHCHPLMRNRRLGRKSDSCWQSTVSSKSWKGIEVLLFWYCRSTEQEARANNIARLIRNISCTRYRTCLLGIANQPNKHMRYRAHDMIRNIVQYRTGSEQNDPTETSQFLHKNA